MGGGRARGVTSAGPALLYLRRRRSVRVLRIVSGPGCGVSSGGALRHSARGTERGQDLARGGRYVKTSLAGKRRIEFALFTFSDVLQRIDRVLLEIRGSAVSLQSGIVAILFVDEKAPRIRPVPMDDVHQAARFLP